MNEQQDLKNLEKYAQDIALIKSLLMSAEHASFIEYWAFYTWGGLFLAGGFLHHVLQSIMMLPVTQVFLYMWLPVIFVGALFETIAWLRKMEKESMPVFSRTMVRLFMLAFGIIISMIMIMVSSVNISGSYKYIPYFILMMYGILILSYGQISYNHFYGFGYFLIFASFMFYMADFSLAVTCPVAAIVLGVNFLVCGILTHRKENKDNDQ